MSSAQTPASISGKSGGSSSTISSSSLPLQAPISTSGVSGNDPSRRGGPAYPGGAGVNATPRNNQSSRKGHRNHKKPASHFGRFAPEVHPEEQMMTSSNGRKGTAIAINWDVSTPHPRFSHSDYHYRPHRNSGRRAPTYGLGSGYHATDKARYVNANYRFIVNPNGDYRAQSVDSDVHLPWDHILQVLASDLTQCANCPICLSTPVAPRMAKCGHIFCLPCLVRYMATTDSDAPPGKKPRYKKCVICTDNVYMNDIRPVRFFTGQQNEPPKDNEDVVLRLIMRRPGSTLALPRDGAELPTDLNEIPWHFAAEVMDYARIMKGSEDYMTEQFNREIEELTLAQQEDEVMYGEDGIWSRKAIGMIRTQIEGLAGMGNPPPQVTPKAKEKEQERPPIVFSENDENVPAMYQVLHEARSGHSLEAPRPAAPVESDTTAVEHAAGGASQDSPYFFYQALLHYYLAPLDIRILKVAFGSFAAFPSTILPRVENVSTGHTVDDSLRKRAKYLAHLPYGCEVGFLECDWTDIVPPETLEKFRPEIERRRKLKRDKELKEERDRLRAEKLENEERWASARQRGEHETFAKRGPWEDEFVALSPPSEPAQTVDDESAFVPETSPSQNGGAGPSAYQRTVWGTAIPVSEEPVRHEQEDSGWLQDWEKELMLEQEMLAQIELEESMEGSSRASNQGMRQKKKKFKKVTLMTNGGKRGA